MRFRVGQQVKVRAGAGLSTGREGVIIPKHLVPTDGRGVPRIEGHYKPLTSHDYAVRDAEGMLFTMPGSYLEPA